MTTEEIVIVNAGRVAIIALLGAGGVWLARKYPRKDKPQKSPVASNERWEKVGRHVGRACRRLANRVRALAK